ncbi:hypothetical protein Scep_021509 [Stephania cephalantha]|uniref:Uncharacterized protein n=1 Tax=Stephania cephalantha TaxID=152367 RepID=A0AAP0F3J5_9MAGN
MYDDEGQSRRQRRTSLMTARASEVATDCEGFRGSDGRLRGLHRQRRQTARALEAATADGTTSGRHHENSPSQSQSQTTTQPPTIKDVTGLDGVEISGFGRESSVRESRRCRDQFRERVDGE